MNGYFLFLFARLVNMLDRKSLDKEKVWKIVKETRTAFLNQYVYTFLSCQDQSTLLSDNIIKGNINTLVEKLKQNASSSPNDKISNQVLQNAVAIFTYLNYCPEHKLSSFIKSIFKYKSPKDILFGLASTIKTSQNVLKKCSTKIFNRAMEIFDLHYYKDIKRIKEEGFDDCGSDFESCNENLKLLGNILLNKVAFDHKSS